MDALLAGAALAALFEGSLYIEKLAIPGRAGTSKGSLLITPRISLIEAGAA